MSYNDQTTHCSDIRVINPRLENQWPDAVYDDDRVRVLSRNGKYQVIPPVPRRQIVPLPPEVYENHL